MAGDVLGLNFGGTEWKEWRKANEIVFIDTSRADRPCHDKDTRKNTARFVDFACRMTLYCVSTETQYARLAGP